MNFSFYLVWKHFICPSILNDSFAGESNLGCRPLHFITLNTFCQSLLPAKFLSCSPYSSDIPMIQMLALWEMSHRFLSLSSFFWILVSSFCSGWMCISFLCSKMLVWILASSPSLLVSCGLFFISLSITLLSSFIYLFFAILKGISEHPDNHCFGHSIYIW